MNKRTVYLIMAAVLMCCGCRHHNELAVFDHPFVYVIAQDDKSFSESSSVNAMANVVRTYSIVLSSREMDEIVDVYFDIDHGDGLIPEVDYAVEGGMDNVSFAPGEHVMPVSIRWMRHEIDPTKDNSLTITLSLCTSEAVELGFPGPAHRNASHRITKVN